MNKRQAKKRKKLEELGEYFGFYHFPKYKEIKEIERGYHEFCIHNYRVEREMENVIKKRVFSN